MTFLTYADPIPVPAPLTSGTTIQTFTDPLGDLWVAKNGVYNGNWYRARDVLHAKYARTTSYTYVQTTPTAIPFNSPVRDPYGLWSSPSFVVPPGCGGLWRADAQLCIAFTAASQFIGMYINFGAVSGVRTNIYSPAVINGYVHGHDCMIANANDNIQVLGYSGTASLVSAGNTGADFYFTVKYEGTG